MYFMMYVSSAVTPFSQPELVELLTLCREKNEKLGITGMLLYKDGSFMQLLEGEETTLRELYTVISRDERHCGILMLHKGFQEERQFTGWSMGFRDLNSPETHALPGYNEFLNTPLTGDEFSSNPGRCWKLFHMFKENAG
jgi:Sensors of blue-light using FAD